MNTEEKSTIFKEIVKRLDAQLGYQADEKMTPHIWYSAAGQTFVFGRLTNPQAHDQGYYWHMTVWATSEINDNNLDVRELFNPTTKLYGTRFDKMLDEELVLWFAERIQMWNIERYEKEHIEPIKKWWREQDLFAYYRKSYSDRRKQDRMFRNQFTNNPTFR